MKAVLLAMTNPYSADPARALWPSPVGCTGWRVWQLIAAEAGATPREYADAFDRVNFITGPWHRDRARRLAPEVVRSLRGREVVVFGSEVRDLIGLPPLLIHPQEFAGAIYRQLPHPSGRCRWYNHPTNKLLASLLLAELYERGRLETRWERTREARVRAPGAHSGRPT